MGKYVAKRFKIYILLLSEREFLWSECIKPLQIYAGNMKNKNGHFIMGSFEFKYIDSEDFKD